MHDDDVAAGVQVTIYRRRMRRVHTTDRPYFVYEPGTITDVKRGRSGRVVEIQARNEVTGTVLWFSVRRFPANRYDPQNIMSGYFKKGLEQSKGYQLILEKMLEAYDPAASPAVD